jgi:hypothetical protein
MIMNELTTLRTIVLVTTVLALIGTGFELIFLGHIEGWAQLIPLVLIVLALLALCCYAVVRTGWCIRTFQVVMGLFLIAGIVGIVLHARSNIEFARELYPNIEPLELLRRTAAGAIPALAPGAMMQIGLMGLAYTFSHPALKRRSK